MRILPVRARTLARLVRISASPYSLLRALQYEAIENLVLEGCVLDVGGDRRSEYLKLIQVRGDLMIVNMSLHTFPTCVCDLELSLPFADGVFDHVISLNTFEHLRNDKTAIHEAVRVLKPGGTFHFLVPFCYRVHGSPRDFHRHTAQWWAETMEALGTCGGEVEPLAWDRWSSAAAVAGADGILRRALMLWGWIDIRGRARRWLRGVDPAAPYAGTHDNPADYAVGYYVRGRTGARSASAD